MLYSFFEAQCLCPSTLFNLLFTCQVIFVFACLVIFFLSVSFCVRTGFTTGTCAVNKQLRNVTKFCSWI
jgi:hypothetical protein